VTFESVRTLEELAILYDGELRAADDQLARVLDMLRERGLYDAMLIVVTADHGELLGEHQTFGHGRSLWEEEVRIPLVVKWPLGEARPGRSDDLVQLTDLLPLLAQRVELALPPGVQGAWPPRRGGAFAEVSPLPHESHAGAWRMWIEGRHKIMSVDREPRRVFDLDADPAEQQNLAESDPTRSRELKERLDAFAAALPPAPRAAAQPSITIDPETQRALRDLGYAE
jgi:arylsulfatase A-like enzyme